MDTPTFDPTRAVVFDLNRGQVTLNGSAAVLVIPAEVLAQVCAGLDAPAIRHFGALLGKYAGDRVRARLSSAPAASLEAMVDQLGGELSLAGLGSLVMERWGQALVVRIEGCPLARAEELMSAYVEAALLAAVAKEVTALVLERNASVFRLLLCNRTASAKVKGWLASGTSWGDALVALHQSPKYGAPGAKL